MKKARKPADVRVVDYSTLVTNAGPLINKQFVQAIHTRTEIANCDLSDPTLKRPKGLIDVSVTQFKWADTPEGS